MPVQILEHPTVIVRVGAAESAGELFRFQYIVRAVTPAPAHHVHREERVEVPTECRPALESQTMLAAYFAST